MCKIGSENASILAFLCDTINSSQEEFELSRNKILYTLSSPFANICNVSMMRDPQEMLLHRRDEYCQWQEFDALFLFSQTPIKIINGSISWLQIQK